LVALAGAAAAAVALAWMADGARGREDVYPPGSAHDASPLGLSLARAYLGAKGASVEMLARPLGVMPPADAAIVFRVQPVGPLDAPRGVVTTAREEEWVRRGGRLVIASDNGWNGLAVRAQSGPAVSVFPGWPDFNPPAGAVFTRAPRGAHALALVGDEPTLLRVPLGKGDVILLAAPGALQNRGLMAPGNLDLLQRLAAGRDPVVFDEDSHGLGHSLGVLDVLLEHGLGPALLLAVLAGLAGALRARRRLGPAEPEAEDTRSDAVDLVDSLAQLYARAITRGEALRLYGDAYTQAVHNATGLSGRALQERVRAGVSGVVPSRSASAEPSAGQFAAGLRALNQAFSDLRGRRGRGMRPSRPAPSRPPAQEIHR
jgi:hypothetical protein